MTVSNITREAFGPEHVEVIVTTELQSGTDELKSRVTAKVRKSTGILNGNLPERVRTWIHQLCIHYIAWLPKKHQEEIQKKKFTGKLAKPIDLISIPNRANT